jgi:hypothetical protein
MKKVLLAVPALMVLAASLAGAAEVDPLAASVTPLTVNQTSLSRQDAIQRVRGLTAIVRRADRFEAKVTTFGEYERARGVQLSSIQGIAGTRPVWLVTAAGEIQPAFNKPRPFTNQVVTYKWAVFVLDPVTGAVLATHAGTNGAWPGFFDKLLDQAP